MLMKTKFDVQIVENGFTVVMTYFFKPNDKDPGHSKQKTFVAKDLDDVMEILKTNVKLED